MHLTNLKQIIKLSIESPNHPHEQIGPSLIIFAVSEEITSISKREDRVGREDRRKKSKNPLMRPRPICSSDTFVRERDFFFILRGIKP